jgi:hypothetical protein
MLSTSNKMSFKIIIWYCAIWGGSTTACTHTHTHMRVCWFQIQTSDLTIKNGHTKDVDGFIAIRVNVVLTEITLCTLQEE